MPDLNSILLFIAWVSPALLLVRSWRGGIDPVWRRAAIAVLLITTLATILARPYAGFIAGAAWLLFLCLPVVGIRKAMDLAHAGKFHRARRILSALRMVHSARHLRDYEVTMQVMESAQAEGRAMPLPIPQPLLFGQTRARFTPIVTALIALNAAMFAAEITLGSATDHVTLQRLGALDPYSFFVGGEYWRVATAPFLHYGALHLFVNLFALFFFGPTFEKAIGPGRFAACYLIAGIGSCAQVAGLWKLGWIDADQLVGASGAIMGIIGAWAGWLFRQRAFPRNRRALRTILLIIAIQTIYDLITPQISMAAHLCGLGTGLLLGLLLAPEKAAR